jgi:hypothetical protein
MCIAHAVHHIIKDTNESATDDSPHEERIPHREPVLLDTIDTVAHTDTHMTVQSFVAFVVHMDEGTVAMLLVQMVLFEQ